MQTTATARDVMVRDYVGVSESDSLADAVDLLVAEDAEGAVVLRGNDQVGSLSATEALAAIRGEDDPAGTTVGAVMDDPLPDISADAAATAVRDRLLTSDRGRLLVQNDDDPVGLVTARKFLTAVPTGPTADAEAAERFSRERESVAPDEAVSTQSVCEACGALSPELAAVDGSLLCADCRGE